MPDEANPELIVNPDTVLSRPVSLERFQAITGRATQIMRIFRGIQIKFRKAEARNYGEFF